MKKTLITILGVIGSIASIIGLSTLDFSLFFSKNITPSLVVSVLKEEKNGLMTILDKEAELKSGDKYQIVFSSSSDGYLYVYQKDSENNVYKLFPNSHYGTSRIYKNDKKHLPSSSTVYSLDSTVGKEIFYFVFFKENLKSMQEKYYDKEKSNTLGIDGIEERNNKFSNISSTNDTELKNIMTRSRNTKGSLVKTIWVNHK